MGRHASVVLGQGRGLIKIANAWRSIREASAPVRALGGIVEGEGAVEEIGVGSRQGAHVIDEVALDDLGDGIGRGTLAGCRLAHEPPIRSTSAPSARSFSSIAS